MKKWLSIAVLAGTFLVSSQHASQAQPRDLEGFVCNVAWFSPEINPGGGRFGFLTGNLSRSPFARGAVSVYSSFIAPGRT